MLTRGAQQHLISISPKEIDAILTEIKNLPPINPFVVVLGYMFFIKNETLVCVKLQKTNGVFILWFDNQIIEFNRPTGDCFIVSFTRNCWEYFSVGNHYRTEKSLQGLFYKILNGEKIPRIGGQTIHSFKLFFSTTKIVGQIERLGCSTLAVPKGCFSIHKMILGIKQFLIEQINHSFLRTPSFFTEAIADVQRNLLHLSVAIQPEIRLFLQTEFDRRLPFSMLSKLMMRLIPECQMVGGVFQKSISIKFLENMFGSILPKILMAFTKNPIGFREAVGSICDLLRSYSIKSTLSSPRCSSILDCVEVMKNEAVRREAEKRKRYSKLEDEYRKRSRIEEERRIKEARHEFRNGISDVHSNFQETRLLSNQLAEICEDSPRKKMKGGK
jgi:hypothetical protein